jgi:hypothetical protein
MVMERLWVPETGSQTPHSFHAYSQSTLQSLSSDGGHRLPPFIEPKGIKVPLESLVPSQLAVPSQYLVPSQFPTKTPLLSL